MFAGSLRDAIGNMVGVMIYHVPYFGPAGGAQHLIGLREQGDGLEAPGRQVGEGPVGDTVPSLGRARSRSGDSSGSSDSGLSAASVTPSESTATADVFLQGRLPIESATQGFRSSFGLQDPGTVSFLDMMQGDEGDVFMAWIHHRAGRVMRGEAVAPFMETYGRAQLCGAGGAPKQHLLRVCFPPAPAAGPYRVSINASKPRQRRGGGGSLGTSPAAASQSFGRPPRALLGL